MSIEIAMCEHLVFRRDGTLSDCGKRATGEYLGMPVCSRHDPHKRAEAKARKAQAMNERLVNALHAIRDITQPTAMRHPLSGPGRQAVVAQDDSLIIVNQDPGDQQ